jgi:TonB-dependent SusC/RagA subfamily outer membrane receptor
VSTRDRDRVFYRHGAVTTAPRSHRLTRALATIASFAFLVLAEPLAGQEAMTVTGRVTIGEQPLAGASIEIPATRLSTRTNATGWYSFLVPAARVQGQRAMIVARHARYGRRSEPLQLTGGSVVRDFDFAAALGTDTARAETPVSEIRPLLRNVQRETSIDSTAFGELAGPLDLVSALAGRVSALRVTSANQPGASAFMVYRGLRSMGASLQPLVVVDGVPLDNSSSATAEQRFGLGGFDYGSPLQDLALDNVASVSMLSGAEAAAGYGARAANGVLLVTSKHGGSSAGWTVSGTIRTSSESPIMLPKYQNAYGQGLDGQYAFFDGAGGGINDGVDQSWGPPLQGQLVAQASPTERGMADVRPWLSHPAGVRDYFRPARTLDATAAAAGAWRIANVRLSIDARNTDGITPSSRVRRLGLAVNAALNPVPRLTGQLNAIIGGTDVGDRPGTGFDEINPLSSFTRIGRQVDLALLRQNIVDAAGHQINWIYTNRDNPFAQSLLNTNRDQRTHATAGGALSFAIARSLAFTLQGGTDNIHQTRIFDVAPGWQGGYPSALGRLDFSRGGTQRQSLNVGESTAGAALSVVRGSTTAGSVTLVVGGDYRRDAYAAATALTGPGSAASDTAVHATPFTSSNTIVAAYATSSIAFHRLQIDAGLRSEGPPSGDQQMFPAVSATLRLLGPHERPASATLDLRGAWWRAGNELSARSAADIYAGASATCAASCAAPSPSEPMVGVAMPSRVRSELTEGFEGGPVVTLAGQRLSVNLTAYSERSSSLLIAFAESGVTTVAQTGAVSNDGVEVTVHAIPARRTAVQWDVAAMYAKNINRVDALAIGREEVSLGPPLFGALLVARVGQPLGTIVGTRFQRAANGMLLLSHGLPLATDSTAPIGAWQPNWTSSVATTLRAGRFELAGLVEGRFGGKIFSATNFSGSYAGTLAVTGARPNGGFVVRGIDVATAAPNSTAVSTEDYYHALGGIHEAWVYDASFVKLRSARVAYALPPNSIPALHDQTVRIAVIARNPLAWKRAPNIDPETTLSTTGFQGFEMGQLPSTRSIGVQLSLTP